MSTTDRNLGILSEQKRIEQALADGVPLDRIERTLDHEEMCARTRPGTVDIDVPRRIANEPLVHPLGDVCDQLLGIINSLTLGPQRESVRITVQALQHAQAICSHSILLDMTEPQELRGATLPVDAVTSVMDQEKART